MPKTQLNQVLYARKKVPILSACKIEYIYLAPGDVTVVKDKLGTIFVYNKEMVIINCILWG